MEPANGYEDWEVTQLLANALGANWSYTHPSEIIDEIARLTPSFAGLSWDRLDEIGSVQWPVNEAHPEGSPVMHVEGFASGKGKFVVTEYVPTDEKTGPRYPLLLTTGRILSQYNVGAQTRRTDNVAVARARTCSRCIRPTPRTAASRPATGRGSPAAPARRRCACWSPTASRRAWSTPPSTTRRRRPTWSPPTSPTGRPTAPSTRSPRCRSCRRNGPTDWQEEYTELSERSRRIAGGAAMEPAE